MVSWVSKMWVPRRSKSFAVQYREHQNKLRLGIRQKKREKEMDALSQKINTPHYIVTYSWGRSHNKDVWTIKGKTSIHGLHGYRNKIKGYKLKKFDKSFGGNDNLKYRLSAQWENCKKNKCTSPVERHRRHNAGFWRSQYYKHVVQLQMSQSEYFIKGNELYEKYELVIDKALRASVGNCFGSEGTRKFNPSTFLQIAAKAKLHPTIHVTNKNIELPRTRGTGTPICLKVKRGSRKVFGEARIYLGMDGEPIQSPYHSAHELQGNYSPGGEIYLA